MPLMYENGAWMAKRLAIDCQFYHWRPETACEGKSNDTLIHMVYLKLEIKFDPI